MNNDFIFYPVPKNNFEEFICSVLLKIGKTDDWRVYSFLRLGDKGIDGIKLMLSKKKYNSTSKKEDLIAVLAYCLFKSERIKLTPKEYCKLLTSMTEYKHGESETSIEIAEHIMSSMNEIAQKVGDRTEFYIIKRVLETGSIEIPWDCIDFFDGFIHIYHPNHLDDKKSYPPYVLHTNYSKKVFSKVAEAFFVNLNTVYAHCTDGHIDWLWNNLKCEHAIEIIDYHTQCPELNYDELIYHCARKWYPSIYNGSRRIGEQDSVYLRYLSSLHMPSVTLCNCIEKMVSLSSSKFAEEEAFLFCIAMSEKKALLVYENENYDRSTVLFIVNRQTLYESIDIIVSYFGSLQNNKREDIMRYRNLFDRDKIVTYYREFHNSFKEWRIAIDNAVRNFYML